MPSFHFAAPYRFPILLDLLFAVLKALLVIYRPEVTQLVVLLALMSSAPVSALAVKRPYWKCPASKN